MGFVYAHNTLIEIVGAYPGLEKEEILDINRRTYRARLNTLWEWLIPQENSVIPPEIIEQDGKYYLGERIKEDCEYGIPEWRENIETLLNYETSSK